jgi:hypothetical protein
MTLSVTLRRSRRACSGQVLILFRISIRLLDLRTPYGEAYEFCKIEVRHTLKRKKTSFVFFFSDSKLLSNKKLGDYLRKSKKTDFLK